MPNWCWIALINAEMIHYSMNSNHLWKILDSCHLQASEKPADRKSSDLITYFVLKRSQKSINICFQKNEDKNRKRKLDHSANL